MARAGIVLDPCALDDARLEIARLRYQIGERDGAIRQMRAEIRQLRSWLSMFLPRHLPGAGRGADAAAGGDRATAAPTRAPETAESSSASASSESASSSESGSGWEERSPFEVLN